VLAEYLANSFTVENRREREVVMNQETLKSIFESEGAVARRSWYRDQSKIPPYTVFA